METVSRTRRAARSYTPHHIHPNEARTLRALDDCKNDRNLVDIDMSSFDAFMACIKAL